MYVQEAQNLDSNMNFSQSNPNCLMSDTSLESVTTSTALNQALTTTDSELQPLSEISYTDFQSNFFNFNQNVENWFWNASPGNTAQEALYLGTNNSNYNGLNVSYEDQLSLENSSDYYVFKLPEIKDSFSIFAGYYVDIDFLEGMDNVDVTLLDQNQNQIPLNSYSYFYNDRFSANVNSGTYYLKISSDNNSYYTPYQFNLKAGGIFATCFCDDVGNTRETAKDIQLNSSVTTYQDAIEPKRYSSSYSDIYDYYKFTLKEAANVSLKLDGLTSDANLALLSESGTGITRSTNLGTSPKFVDTFLNKGTYYIRVSGGNTENSNTTTYQLTTSAIFTESEVNDSRTTSDVIQLDPDYNNNSFVKFNGTINEGDLKDFYKFTLNQQSGVTVGVSIKLDSLSADLDLRLLDENGNQIDVSKLTDTQAETIQASLTNGTYYVQVIPWFDSISDYSLTVQAGAFADSYESNNTISSATALTVNQTPQTYKASLHQNDNYDYYRFSLSETSDFSLTLNGLIGDADVVLLDSYSNYIAGSFNWNTSNESINIQLASGNYYLCVYPYQKDVTEYNLTLQALPTPILPCLT